MAKVERGYHSLATIEEASRTSDELPIVTFNLKLPEYVPTEGIGVHLRRIHRLMRLGGMRRLDVTGESGQVVLQEPAVSGIAGVGVAAAEGVVDKDRSETYSDRRRPSGPDQPPFLAGRWVDVTLPLNITDMAARIGRRNHRIRDPKPWANELNQEVTDGIVKEGIGHLIHDLTDFDKSDMLFAGVYGGLFGCGGLIVSGEWKPLVPGLITGIIIGNLSVSINNRYLETEIDPSQFRRSLFAGPQIDRALVLSTLSRQRIIK